LKYILSLSMLMLASTSLMLAGTQNAPEINAQSGAAALALLSGGLMILRSRKK
jgi:hypothetical protein